MRRLWAALVVSGCTCDPLALNGTALRMRVNIDSQVTVSQVRFAATLDGGALFAPVVRPDPPQGPLASGGSLLALLPDTLDGQTVACEVEGLHGGAVVATDRQTARIMRGVEVSCTAQLLPAATCDASCAGCCMGNICLSGARDDACGTGGERCALCGAGQRCIAGACQCDAASCTGCCSGTVCLDGGSATACGRNGAMCGGCQAGQDCTAGACTCDGGACLSGCNAVTCPGGCCSQGNCTQLTAEACAPPGLGFTCTDCRSAQADSCDMMGQCSCGNRGSPCPATQHCVGGQCVCDETVCAGCCQGATCHPGDEKQRCGADGGSCRNCIGGTQCMPGGVCQ